MNYNGCMVQNLRTIHEEVKNVTEMRRVTISIPEEIDKAVLEMKKTDEFVRDSYSEIIRKLLLAGLAKVKK